MVEKNIFEVMKELYEFLDGLGVTYQYNKADNRVYILDVKNFEQKIVKYCEEHGLVYCQERDIRCSNEDEVFSYNAEPELYQKGRSYYIKVRE